MRLASSVLGQHLRTLQNELGVSGNRTKGVIGQYRKWRTFELWLVSTGANLPAIKQ